MIHFAPLDDRGYSHAHQLVGNHLLDEGTVHVRGCTTSSTAVALGHVPFSVTVKTPIAVTAARAGGLALGRRCDVVAHLLINALELPISTMAAGALLAQNACRCGSSEPAGGADRLAGSGCRHRHRGWPCGQMGSAERLSNGSTPNHPPRLLPEAR